MLGLPDGVRACLFDLDGVLTRTAKVHAERGSRCSMVFCVTGRRWKAVRLYPSIRLPTTRSMSTGSRASTGYARSLLRAASPCGGRGERSDDRRHRRGTRQSRERDRAPHDPRLRCRSLRGLGALRSRSATGWLDRAVVSSSSNCREVLVAAGIEVCSSGASVASRRSGSTWRGGRP